MRRQFSMNKYITEWTQTCALYNERLKKENKTKMKKIFDREKYIIEWTTICKGFLNKNTLTT